MSDANQNGSQKDNGSSKPKKFEVRDFTPEDYEVYLAARAVGSSVKVAAKRCGFAVSTIYRYQEIHPEHWEAFKKAVRQHALSVILEAAKKNWQAAGWVLERCFPDEFALRVVNRTHLTGEIDQKVKLIDFERLKQMHKLAADLAQEAPRFGLS